MWVEGVAARTLGSSEGSDPGASYSLLGGWRLRTCPGVLEAGQESCPAPGGGEHRRRVSVVSGTRTEPYRVRIAAVMARAAGQTSGSARGGGLEEMSKLLDALRGKSCVELLRLLEEG